MKWDFSEMIVEPLSNEFTYRSIEDERSDTKILRGGACLENGNFVDCHDISDLQLPRGEFPDPTIILKQVLGVSDAKIIAEQNERNTENTANDQSIEATISTSESIDTSSIPQQIISNNKADCESSSIVYDYHRQKNVGPAVTFDRGSVSSLVMEPYSQHNSARLAGSSTSSSFASSPPTPKRQHPNELQDLLNDARRKHESTGSSSSVVSSWMSTLFKK